MKLAFHLFSYIYIYTLIKNLKKLSSKIIVILFVLYFLQNELPCDIARVLFLVFIKSYWKLLDNLLYIKR